jgi:hypothetical protein
MISISSKIPNHNTGPSLPAHAPLFAVKKGLVWPEMKWRSFYFPFHKQLWSKQ